MGAFPCKYAASRCPVICTCKTTVAQGVCGVSGLRMLRQGVQAYQLDRSDSQSERFSQLTPPLLSEPDLGAWIGRREWTSPTHGPSTTTWQASRVLCCARPGRKKNTFRPEGLFFPLGLQLIGFALFSCTRVPLFAPPSGPVCRMRPFILFYFFRAISLLEISPFFPPKNPSPSPS